MQKIKIQKLFSFWDNCMWMGCIKFALLGREHLSTALIMLKQTVLSFFVSLKETFCNYIAFLFSNKSAADALAQI